MKIFNDKLAYVYDIEVYPNMFGVTFKNVDDSQIHQFSLFKNDTHSIDTIPQMLKFINREMYLIGFNNDLYDNTILNIIINDYYRYKVNEELSIKLKGRKYNSDTYIQNFLDNIYQMSGLLSEYMKSKNNRMISLTDENESNDVELLDDDDGIIDFNLKDSFNDDSDYSSIKKFRYSKNIKYESIDLFLLMAFDKLGVGLKQCAINLKHNKIQDLPYVFDKPLSYEQYLEVMKYNINDCDITHLLLKDINVIEGIELRLELSKKYNVNLLSASNSRIGNNVFEDKYAKETGVSRDNFIKARTVRKYIKLKECISKDIKFKRPELIKLLDDINNTVVYFSKSNPSKISSVTTNGIKVYTRSSTESFSKSHKESVLKPSFETSVTLNNKTYDIGLGGIHSRDDCAIYEAKDGYRLLDGDVDSFYPFIMLNNSIYPAHLDPRFLPIFKDIVDTRIEAKKTAKTNFHDKITAESLKITINALFGKLGFIYYFLFDMKALYSVTLNGQLYLLMIIERLLESDIEVISANTDGIISYFHESKSDEYYKIFNEWAKECRFGVSYTEYKKYIRTDINNYITLDIDNKIKDKGLFVRNIDLKKGYDMPIVPKALYNYYINNIPVDKTLKECNDILDFCKSQKANRKYQMQLHYVENGEYKIKNEQKSIRFYCSKAGVSIIKKDKEKPSNSTGINLLSGQYATTINEMVYHDDFSKYDINYNYYKREIESIINQVGKGRLVKGRSGKGLKSVKAHHVQNNQMSMF